MYRLLRIADICPLKISQVKSQSDGSMRDFHTQGYVLTDGINTIYAETKGAYADAVQALKLEVGATVSVHLEANVFSKDYEDGSRRYFNELRITNISPFMG